MSGRAEFLLHAERLIGTRFKHQGRDPRFGLDCVGLALCAYTRAGVDIEDFPAYRYLPDPVLLEAHLERSHERTDIVEPGDILTFRFRPELGPQHVAIAYRSDMILHVQGRHSRVRSQPYSDWSDRFSGAWKLREDRWPS